ncbi:hypothetical protein C7N83_06995 [Neisseria iguanae]|uniref:Uncharacterized protein n=1 Tax=Neisseria iguanae TaxID=90242 RepID=A0A2P7U014_9NEIS|nr:hypothetical protein C7N83_06995 [Neisseria iguanae]
MLYSKASWVGGNVADIAAVKVCGQAELSVVGESDGLFIAAETEYRCDRAEDFFFGELKCLVWCCATRQVA